MQSRGWNLFVHPLFQEQLEKLTIQVEKLAARDPIGYASHPAAKTLATVLYYVEEGIPRDPNSCEFRQGNTLGVGNRHWFRAKFHGRYRLFYRFSTEHKSIVHAWINDDGSLRKAGSRTDPYSVFQAMLAKVDPPGSFTDLLRTSRKMVRLRGNL
jgi:toxin YhaV